MIDLNDVRRVRLYRGAANHAIADPGARPLTTACGLPVKLTGPTGRAYDQALPPTHKITCIRCKAIDTEEQR
ncbi:hypothetical protein [Streptomyces sp. NPDC059649]|uniref:hypothetical protein n=1 Tax=Streptomyces sp. NPDC059649 TaxID=3346895 RepID=UPI003697DA71